MKALRKILKLFPPAFLMRRWLDRRYGIKVPPAPGGALARLVLAVLPYAFTATLSVRVESDCRLLKYFLPYGRMKKFVRLMYGMRVGSEARDCGAVGMLRAIMPYGLVLWWDAEGARLPDGPRVRGCQMESRKAGSGRSLSDKERRELARLDRQTALSLRYLMMTGRQEGMNAHEME